MKIPPIIGFAGKKQSGKDYALKILQQLYPSTDFIRISFADAVKQEIAFACSTTVGEIEKNKEKFRLILQWWGTDFRRNMQDKDYWTKVWLKKVNYILDNHPSKIIVATDIRFQNELDIIHSLGGKVYEIVSNHVIFDRHESELMGLENIDYEILNDKTDNFVREIKQLTEKEWK